MTGPGAGPDADAALEDALRSLLATRQGSVCPSEAARAVAGEDEEAWRPLMPAAREAAARLADGGEAEVTQRGEVVDVRTARGPVRVRRAVRSGDQDGQFGAQTT
jgi:hypothetical protein